MTEPSPRPQPEPRSESPRTATAGAPRELAAASGQVVLERGHVDLVEVTRAGAALRLQVKDDTMGGEPVFRSPEQVQLGVGDAARTPVPGTGFGFLGPPGSQVFLLPQVQDPNLVWPGWSTERLSAGQVAGDVVRMRLVGVDGPGELAVFTTDQFGSPTVLFDSDGSGPNELTVPIRTHAHANWAFDRPGTYRVTIEVAGELVGAGPTATRATYVFLVGDAATPVDPATVPPPSTVGAPKGPGGALGGADGAQDGESDTPSAVRAGATPAQGAASSGSLPRTGGDALTLGGTGAGLVAAGLLAVAFARGRRRAALSIRSRR